MAQDINTAAETVVGPSVKIQGDLNSEGNIRIEGSVTGKINTTQSVHVGEGAVIVGNVKVSGNLILQASARVHGDIACGILRVEDGAQFTGKCNMKGAAPEKVKVQNVPEPEK
jgi:cytoskeletal protein CcmA (bactofilin family)